MRKTIAILFTIIYTCFISGTLWSSPSASHFVNESSAGNDKERNEPEPHKHFETPHISKVVKNLPGKIKLPRAYHVLFNQKKPFPADTFLSSIPLAGARDFILHSTPLFIRNNVFRI